MNTDNMDFSVTQSDELRAFSHASSDYGERVRGLCRRGMDECQNAIKDAEFFRFRMQEIVADAERKLYVAERALREYESQDHTDSEGNSTYDSSYAANLRAVVEEAQWELDAARRDEQNVLARYQQVKQEVDTLRGELSSAERTISNYAEIARLQINEAADYVDIYKGIINRHAL